MAIDKNGNEWNKINPSTLSAVVKKAYDEMKAAYLVSQAKRKTFEALMADHVGITADSGLELRFNYRWGDISVAAVPAEAKAKSSSKTISVGDLAAKLKAAGAHVG